MVLIKRLVLSILVLGCPATIFGNCPELFFGSTEAAIGVAGGGHALSGPVLLDGGTFENASIHSSLSLSLTMSGVEGAVINLCDLDTTLKAVDSITTFNSNNIIKVSKTFTINGKFFLERDSELTFVFDDQAADPRVVFNSDFNLLLKSRVKVSFSGNGTVQFKDGFVITLGGTYGDSDKPEISCLNSASLTVGPRLTSPIFPVATIKGVGQIFLDSGGEIRMDAGKHLVIGGQGVNIDDIDIVVDRSAVFKASGDASRISVHQMLGTFDFEQGGRLAVDRGGIIEINSLAGASSPGTITIFKVDTEGQISVNEGGRLLLGENIDSASFNWDSAGGIIGGSGGIQFVEQPNFVGQPLGIGRRFANGAITVELLLRELVNTSNAMGISTVFVSPDGQNRLRVKDSTTLGVVASAVPVVNLLDGDTVTGEDPSGIDGLDAGEELFRVLLTGARVGSA